MKRKITLTLLLTALVCLLLSVSAGAVVVDSGTCGENLTWELDDQGVLTISGTGAIRAYAFEGYDSLTSVTILDGVTGIGTYAFYNCDSLSSVMIPGSVTSVGDFSFYKCDSLTSVTILDGVTRIGVSAFSNCGKLTSVTIPDSITIIGGFAFTNCGSLAGVTIPDSVTGIGDYAFYNCDSLTSVTIPGSVTSIGAYAFSGCDSLSSVTIPGSVTSIGAAAFRDCISLTSVTIPDGVTSVGSYAFYNCGKLNSVTIPDSVTSIGDSAFASCGSLTSIAVSPANPAFCSEDGVLFNKNKTTLIQYPAQKNNRFYTIPSTVVTIGAQAFRGVANLREIVIPASVTDIGDYAFGGSSSSKVVVFLGNAPAISQTAFSGSVQIYYPSGDSTWTADIRQNYGGKLTWTQPAYGTLDSGLVWELETDGTLTFYGNGVIPDFTTSAPAPWHSFSTSVRKIVIPDGVTAIGSYAFYNCYYLAHITIPDSIAAIGDCAFSSSFYLHIFLREITIGSGLTDLSGFTLNNYRYLQNFTVSEGNPNFCSVDGVLFNKTKTTLIRYPAQKEGLIYHIPGTVATIGKDAFYACGLNEVAIPASVVSIEEYAFRGYYDDYWYDQTPSAIKYISFFGSAPAFAGRESVWPLSYPFSSVTATVTFPAGDPSWTNAAKQKAGGTLTWVATTYPAVIHQPVNGTYYTGEVATFSVWAVGNDLSYQWQYNLNGSGWKDSDHPGNKSTTLDVSATLAYNGCQFRCVVKDQNGETIISDAATLTVVSGLSIATHPKDVSSKVGNIAVFTVEALGSELSYQWQQRMSADAEWTDIASSNNKDISVPVSASRIGYQFRCVVTDRRGVSVTSDAATLIMQEPSAEIIAPVAEGGTYSAGLTLSQIALTGGKVTNAGGTSVAGTWAWAQPNTLLYAGTVGYTAVFTPADSSLCSVQATVEVTVSPAAQTLTSIHGSPQQICTFYAGPGLEMRDMVSSDRNVVPVFVIAEDEGEAYVEGTVLYSPDAGFVTVEACFPGVDVNGDGIDEYAAGSVEIHTKFTTVPMFRMYDPNAGEHFYTGSEVERDILVAAGWHYEGVGFNYPAIGAPVYRLYNPVSGDHLYTMDEAEIARKTAGDWRVEGVAFNSAAATEIPQYRLWNPNAVRGAWHFTSDAGERAMLIAAGWQDQGIGWYSTRK